MQHPSLSLERGALRFAHPVSSCGSSSHSTRISICPRRISHLRSSMMGTAASVPDEDKSPRPPTPPPPPQPRPFDWYADPLYYDIIFQEDTPVETSMLRQIARHYAAEGSPMRRIRPEPEPEPEPSSEEEADGTGGPERTVAAAAAAQAPSTGAAGASSVAALACPPSPAVIRVLEPACGSGRLMLSLLEAGAASDPRDVSWSVAGFDLSEGAVRFAQSRWEQLEPRLARNRAPLRDATAAAGAAAVAAASTAAAPAATSTTVATAAATVVPAFIAFVGDMRHFSQELSSALCSSPSAPPQPQFDLAHCLVSSLKHLLDPAEVLAHFEEVHAALVPGGVYVVAMHIHTLYGRSHFDRDVRYAPTAASNVAAAATAKQPNPAEAAAGATVAAAAVPVAASSAAANGNSGDRGIDPNGDEAEASDDSEDEIDDAFERAYERDGTRFKAELITYAPDAETMLEKMIARVQLNDGAPSASPASAASPSPSASVSPPLQSDMSLRVYTLSSLHTLLCSLAPLFSLGGVFNYADIYEPAWRASDPRAALPYPYPAPSLAQLASPAHPAPKHPFVPRATQRNWNRVYPVSKSVKDVWDGVEAVVVVLRKEELPV